MQYRFNQIHAGVTKNRSNGGPDFSAKGPQRLVKVRSGCPMPPIPKDCTAGKKKKAAWGELGRLQA